jgi:hypothetical protein
VVLVLLVLSPLGATVRAEVLRYSLEIRDREAAGYVVDLPVRHAGTLRVDLEWPGRRTLALRIEGPGSPRVQARRAGPSPLHLEVEVSEPPREGEEGWQVHIRSLPDRGRAEGLMTVTLPSPEDREAPEHPEPSPSRPPRDRDPWTRSRTAPEGTDPGVARLFGEVESFRSWVVDEAGSPRDDACGWQSDLLRYLTEHRDSLAEHGRGLDESLARYFLRLARTVRNVDALRSSDDPILAGPVPEKTLTRRAWETLRRERLEPLEHELDALGEAVRGGYVTALDDRSWPMRLIGCLTACERYFEQRVRLGEGRAPNGDLAGDQWDGILAAADALDALATADEEPAMVVGEAQTSP